MANSELNLLKDLLMLYEEYKKIQESNPVPKDSDWMVVITTDGSDGMGKLEGYIICDSEQHAKSIRSGQAADMINYKGDASNLTLEVDTFKDFKSAGYFISNPQSLKLDQGVGVKFE